MAGLQLYPQNLGAIDEDSDYTPANSPNRTGGSFAQSAYTPTSAAGWSTPGSSPGGYEFSPSPVNSQAKKTFSFSHTDFDDENPDDDLASTAIGDDSDNEDSDEEYGQKNNWINPDVLYQDECGYALVKLLRGSSCGRCIKRCVFKMAVVGLCCAMTIMIISYLESRLFAFTRYFQTSPYGATLQTLMWVASISEMFMSVMSLVFIKYWASTVTNRKLFTQLLRLYMVMQVATVMFGIWMLGVLYSTFEEVDRWQDDITLAMMYPYYVCTWLFTLPYLVVTLYYTSDISFYMDDLVTDVGVIDEEDPPADRVDLSDVSFNQVLLLLVATPVMVVVQFFDLFIAIYLLGCRYIEIRRKQARERAQKRAELKAKHLEEKTRGSSVWTRVVRTLKRRWKRWCCSGKAKTLALVTSLDDVPPSPYAHKPLGDEEPPVAYKSPENAGARELQERLARERAMEEEEKRNAKKAAESKARLEAEAIRQREARELQDEYDRAELARKLEDEKKDAAPTLDVPRFKAIWSALATTGSFSAKLRMLPSLAGFTEHLRNQGFHIVFASAPTSSEIEVGICNIRTRPSEKWFMARFVSSPTDFSAVMKAEDPEYAGAFVKKFSLARILKIDTSKRESSPTRSPQK